MDIVQRLEALEDLFYGEWEEDRAQLIPHLLELHMGAASEEDTLNRFLVQTAGRFGGAYIPYLFWDKLSFFYNNPLERIYLHELIRVFINSDFGDEEQKMMKPLLVVYFAKEKTFEIDKIQTMLLDAAHPVVKDYFHKLFSFVEKNQRATEMYCEKFELLKDFQPDFELFSLPVTQLRERLQDA
ncbi:MAG: hypothetical protein NW241_08055 [Bacteroidia bacterium]|nr:hypothetical protein [Bacteroidia bacterium]